MFIVLVENDSVYIAHFKHFTPALESDYSFQSIEQNLHTFSLKGHTNSLMSASDNLRDSDLLRYNQLWSGPLSIPVIQKMILPKMRKLLKPYHRMKDDSFIDTYCIAQANKAFIIKDQGKIIPVHYFYTTDAEEFITGSLRVYKHLPPEERLLKTIQLYSRLYDYQTYPIVISNTKSKSKVYVDDSEGFNAR